MLMSPALLAQEQDAAHRPGGEVNI
jgi:hypothetical protein